MEKIDHNITVNREEYDSLVKKLQITGIYGMYIVASKQVNRPDNCSVDSSLYPQDTETLDILHMFFDTTTREMIALSTVLNPLSVFLRKDQFELLLFSTRPNIVVNLVVLTPHLETRIIIYLKEMITHLII